MTAQRYQCRDESSAEYSWIEKVHHKIGGLFLAGQIGLVHIIAACWTIVPSTSGLNQPGIAAAPEIAIPVSS